MRHWLAVQNSDGLLARLRLAKLNQNQTMQHSNIYTQHFKNLVFLQRSLVLLALIQQKVEFYSLPYLSAYIGMISFNMLEIFKANIKEHCALSLFLTCFMCYC